MEKIYSDLKNPAGLSSIEKLYREVKKNDHEVTKNYVVKILNFKESYTLRKGTRNRFPRRNFF